MKKKVCLIFTGGTISMKKQKDGSAIPKLSATDLIKLVPGIDNIDVEIIQYSMVASPSITPTNMFEISKIVKEKLSEDSIDGVVISQGTDTLEETAFFIDNFLDSSKPIVLTGSMRNASELGYDGPNNLSAAIRVAMNETSKNRGTLVVLNDEINSAFEVTKSHTDTLDTFKSLEFGSVGIINQNEIYYHRQFENPIPNLTFEILETDVHLVKVSAGMDPIIIDTLVNRKVKGIVIEALGSGNVHPFVADSIYKAIDCNIPVVVVSRCPKGSVKNTYGYPGGGKLLNDYGAIFARKLSGHKARILLMMAISSKMDLLEVFNIK